jgi:membrane-associated protein
VGGLLATDPPFCREVMEFITSTIDLFLHLDTHLDSVIQQYGQWTYLVLFVIIFCETGLVVTPILPGDSLLFAAGTFAARGSMDVTMLMGLLIVAAILGDAVNYSIGRALGPRVLSGKHRFLKQEYLQRTQRFYERYGGKTIIFARFVPIIRTFAPFLAGVGSMNYGRFALFNVTGAVLWIVLFVLGGFFFGNIPLVKDNFTLVILGVIVVSVLPAVIEAWRGRRESLANAAKTS